MKPRKLDTHECSCFFNDDEISVKFVYRPGRPGRWYLDNGDPGYPDDPPEIEVIDLAGDDKKPIQFEELTQEQQATVEQACWDHIEELSK